MRRPDVDTIYAVIDALMNGESITNLAIKYKISKLAMIEKIRYYPDILDKRLKDKKPILYDEIMAMLKAGKKPNKISMLLEIEPILIFTLIRHQKSLSK